jgi:hypothetical protein
MGTPNFKLTALMKLSVAFISFRYLILRWRSLVAEAIGIRSSGQCLLTISGNQMQFSG